ncbi:hypothetical protein TREMEDRAFT_62393 [Tremella mesenterica DSM 1558]|uniref:uncharacterized protein n=1 Tax=Tremella mesenterica (strain ATCC 24925 / CBS 8224 / DSM 1558 / NBRC 9311 / NRRL Y-6157 / RJB 2259-6 / UBC 559-6) TaxID=578456 RepID=UPI0003F4A281|nr:uncharacterized protein TREMEDRAFT_62393 [Tremella mesenterica DSM 1558]EIW69533.1 hypothetical protein TREMEDRAFT_62393 [Tremella mesenterica DSM 1558]
MDEFPPPVLSLDLAIPFDDNTKTGDSESVHQILERPWESEDDVMGRLEEFRPRITSRLRESMNSMDLKNKTIELADGTVVELAAWLMQNPITDAHSVRDGSYTQESLNFRTEDNHSLAKLEIPLEFPVSRRSPRLPPSDLPLEALCTDDDFETIYSPSTGWTGPPAPADGSTDNTDHTMFEAKKPENSASLLPSPPPVMISDSLPIMPAPPSFLPPSPRPTDRRLDLVDEHVVNATKELRAPTSTTTTTMTTLRPPSTALPKSPRQRKRSLSTSDQEDDGTLGTQGRNVRPRSKQPKW